MDYKIDFSRNNSGSNGKESAANLKFLKKALSLIPEIEDIIQANDIEIARKKLVELSYEIEESIENGRQNIHPFERSRIRQATGVFRNFLSKRNELKSNHSFLQTLYSALKSEDETSVIVSLDFVDELKHLLNAISGKPEFFSFFKEEKFKSGSYNLKGQEAAILRSCFLDRLSEKSSYIYDKYLSGLDQEVILKRRNNVKKILGLFRGSREDWKNYRWHLGNIVRDADTLSKIVNLTDEEIKAINNAINKNIPFGITPYYVSLMDKDINRKFDHAVRAQVIPTMDYVDRFSCLDKKEMDFMLESETSPICLVTRRYPMIVIFKPFNACAQICVYCQRNWEIDGVCSPHSMALEKEIDNAINWIEKNKAIKAVLITGGDPLLLTDQVLDDLIGRLCKIPHIERIRLGTRTPVVMPFRFTPSLVRVLKKYHVPGKKEICIVTHFEHPYEITPEAMKAVQDVKKKTSINFYNQQVFTVENSRRFETVALRRGLKSIGVDPYYVFHAKGKKETEYFTVPIARMLQERNEEARLNPGVMRTDEPVYNIPGIGKNCLIASYDHELIMITPLGQRVYEMHPWDKFFMHNDTYIYTDVSIRRYLEKLAERGENIEDYGTIWFYY